MQITPWMILVVGPVQLQSEHAPPNSGVRTQYAKQNPRCGTQPTIAHGTSRSTVCTPQDHPMQCQSWALTSNSTHAAGEGRWLARSR
jgi:hypothetical protein